MATRALRARATDLAARVQQVRRDTLALCAPLQTEDLVAQSMPDASPTRWHLAHTTWFFETFVLAPYAPHVGVYRAGWAALFNSYYETVGTPFARSRRGLLTRPTVREVLAYRAWADEHLQQLLDHLGPELPADLEARLELGLQHEQQHQELILTDVLHLFAQNPLQPGYRPAGVPEPRPAPEHGWLTQPGGLYAIGYAGPAFCFDNEAPRHRTWLPPFALGTRLVTNGEYLRFVEDGGYARPELWLADGIAAVRAERWQAPLYWRQHDGQWAQFTLHGLRPLDPAAPVCHVSFYEADAYARWAGARLPGEAEWEVAAAHVRPSGGYSPTRALVPAPARHAGLQQLFGECWQWTQSAYLAYPGYRPPPGALGEYNGKFMCNQMVLRGGSCCTPHGHMRRTYRNFFVPAARWQFTGIRLASDADRVPGPA